jgi:uncharacterized protein YndB with AHSA1/START domain
MTAALDPHASELALVLERVVKVPRPLAFEVWTSPEHLAHWWGPRDEEGREFSMPHCEMDFRPGGLFRICIRSPGGEEYWHSGQYREITPPERLAFTFAWERAGDSFPQTLVEVDFVEDGPAATRIRFRQSGLPSVSERDGHETGWGECLDRLVAHLDSAQP